MKKTVIILTAAAILLNVTAQPAAAESDLMNFRMSAAQTAFSVDALADGDAVTHGALYIDNYTAISQVRVILKSDAPLVIENGDYTRDPSQIGPDGNPKIAFFSDYSTAAYTQYNAETGRSNLALWYGPETGESGGNYYASGTVDQADSSFLSFDIRIPQGTAVGDYTCYISTDSRQLAETIVEYDFFALNHRQKLAVGTDLTLTPVKLAVYRRGDVNCDGTVDVEDAMWTLQAYVTASVADLPFSDEIFGDMIGIAHGYAACMAADASEDGNIELEDAMGILTYSVESIAGNAPEWSNIFK